MAVETARRTHNDSTVIYTRLANLFSKVTGTTIEQYIINQKIECVKS